MFVSGAAALSLLWDGCVGCLLSEVLSRVDVGVSSAVRMRPGQMIPPAAAAAALLFLLSSLSLTSGCNKALCASDVSKCLIQVRAARRPHSKHLFVPGSRLH